MRCPAECGRGGRPPIERRQALAGIVYRLRTGCKWKALPSEFGSGSAVHRWFQTWAAAGIFHDIFEGLVRFYHDLRGVDWRWASLDSAIVKAPKRGD
jgi:transposase